MKFATCKAHNQIKTVHRNAHKLVGIQIISKDFEICAAHISTSDGNVPIFIVKYSIHKMHRFDVDTQAFFV